MASLAPCHRVALQSVRPRTPKRFTFARRPGARRPARPTPRAPPATPCLPGLAAIQSPRSDFRPGAGDGAATPAALRLRVWRQRLCSAGAAGQPSAGRAGGWRVTGCLPGAWTRHRCRSRRVRTPRRAVACHSAWVPGIARRSDCAKPPSRRRETRWRDAAARSGRALTAPWCGSSRSSS